jgi:hypothetical protein
LIESQTLHGTFKKVWGLAKIRRQIMHKTHHALAPDERAQSAALFNFYPASEISREADQPLWFVESHLAPTLPAAS